MLTAASVELHALWRGEQRGVLQRAHAVGAVQLAAGWLRLWLRDGPAQEQLARGVVRAQRAGRGPTSPHQQIHSAGTEDCVRL